MILPFKFLFKSRSIIVIITIITITIMKLSKFRMVGPGLKREHSFLEA